ncbi:MAG: phospholipase D family protein [Betaproteobacteria bacterium]|nr:phospholipase D family protein [Betaproteobacteria bacterium]
MRTLSLPRFLLDLTIASLLVASNPALAKKESFTSAIAGAVDELIDRYESISLPAKGTVEVAFSPKGGCTAATVRFIGEAKKSIRLAAYGLTSNPIGKALVEAKKRGVDVRAVLDREHNGKRDNPNSVANFLAANGIPVRIDKAVRIQHNKVIIVDGQSVQNGSFNFTAAAQKSNAENIIIHRGFPELAKTFTDNWNHLWSESEDYKSSY